MHLRGHNPRQNSNLCPQNIHVKAPLHRTNAQEKVNIFFDVVVVYCLIFLNCSLIFFAFASTFAWV